jgi:enoyl-CoA hydratase/carnithine racemase
MTSNDRGSRDTGVDSASNPLLVERSGRVVRLTLNRPDRLNALDSVLYTALTEQLRSCAEDTSVCCVVLAGTGRAFCAGQDLGEMRQKQEAVRPVDGFLRALIDFPKPLIAAVDGMAIGLGCTLLLHADFVLVGDSARLRMPFTSLGLSPEAGSSVLLPLRIGPQAAKRLLYTGGWFSASEAVEMGFADAQHAGDDLLAQAHRLADELAELPLDSLVAVKDLTRAPIMAQVEAAIEREDATLRRLGRGPANREAVRALRERRPPVFYPDPAVGEGVD